jgi:hypothetical protein
MMREEDQRRYPGNSHQLLPEPMQKLGNSDLGSMRQREEANLKSGINKRDEDIITRVDVCKVKVELDDFRQAVGGCWNFSTIAQDVVDLSMSESPKFSKEKIERSNNLFNCGTF